MSTPEALPAPPLGPERRFMDLTCGRIVGDGDCNKPATWHFAWNDEIDNGLCCDEHATEAHEQGWGADWHPITEVCTMPDSVWVGSQHSPPGRCEWQMGDGTRVRSEAARARLAERWASKDADRAALVQALADATSPAVTEPRSVPEPSTVDSGCSSKVQPSVCFRCGLVIFDGGVHRNGYVECYMDEVETS